MQPPDELRDGSRGAGWLNKLRAWCLSTRLVEGIGYRLNQTSRGVSLEILPGEGGGGKAKNYRVKSIAADYLVCRTWGGTNNTADDGETDIYIARDPELRKTRYNGRSINFSSDGDAFTASYTYSSNTKRTKTVNGTAEVQAIVPYYKTDETVITAIEAVTEVDDATGKKIKLLEVTQRAWAKIE